MKVSSQLQSLIVTLGHYQTLNVHCVPTILVKVKIVTNLHVKTKHKVISTAMECKQYTTISNCVQKYTSINIKFSVIRLQNLTPRELTTFQCNEHKY